jgi:hypothetical protein
MRSPEKGRLAEQWEETNAGRWLHGGPLAGKPMFHVAPDSLF